MSSKKEIESSINENISDVRSKLSKNQEMLSTLEDDLSVETSISKIREIKEDIKLCDDRVHQLEQHLYDLEFRKMEINLKSQDEGKKSYIAIASILVSVVLTVVLIVLTYQQLRLNEKILITSGIESLYAHTDLVAELDRISLQCMPLLDDLEVEKNRELMLRIKKNENKIQNLMEKYRRSTGVKTNDIKKQINKILSN